MLLIVILPGGLLQMLAQALGNANYSSIDACLFTANITPGHNDTAATYTGAEANFTGYSRQSIAPGSWSATGYSDPTYTYTGPNISWNSSGPFVTSNNIYGAFLLAHGTSSVLGAERFSFSPVPITSAGQWIVWTPAITGKSLNP